MHYFNDSHQLSYQWTKGSGTSRCKGCVSGPAKSASTANTTSTSNSGDASANSISKKEEKSSFLNIKVKSPLKSPLKRSKSKKTQQQQQQNEKEPANPPSPTKNISKVSDEKAALATITSAIASDSSSSLVAVYQKPGEPSTEDSSKASAPKMVKVKTAEKNHGNPIGNFFGGIVRGVQSLQSLVRPPCLKSIEQQVVVGNEHLKMKEQLEMDAKE